MSRRGRLPDATWTAFTEAIRFIVVPYVLIDLITKNYPQLTTAFMPHIQLYVLFFGTMITVASTVESANKPGSFKRMLFGITALAFVCMWVFVIFGGGIADFTYGPYYVRFDMSKIVYIMLLGISLKGLLVLQTFSAYRKSFAEEQRRISGATKAQRAARARTVQERRRRMPQTFESLRKLSYEVTHDYEVGYSPPPQVRRARRLVAERTCSVCGEAVHEGDRICRSCGAWLAEDSFR